MGQAFGMQGDSFAIPTKDKTIRHTLPLDEIQKYVNSFIGFADKYGGVTLDFQVTRIGCGLAGLKDEQIAPMFKGAPDNCWFDEAWKPWLGDTVLYWGHF